MAALLGDLGRPELGQPTVPAGGERHVVRKPGLLAGGAYHLAGVVERVRVSRRSLPPAFNRRFRSGISTSSIAIAAGTAASPRKCSPTAGRAATVERSRPLLHRYPHHLHSSRASKSALL
jgi:hypothetical protein